MLPCRLFFMEWPKRRSLVTKHRIAASSASESGSERVVAHCSQVWWNSTDQSDTFAVQPARVRARDPVDECPSTRTGREWLDHCHHALAKVRVAGSNLVVRSVNPSQRPSWPAVWVSDDYQRSAR